MRLGARPLAFLSLNYSRRGTYVDTSADVAAWFKSRSQLRVADVDARMATPQDPTLTFWGLASSTPSAPGATRKMSPFYIRNMLRKATFFQHFDDL